MSINCYFSFLVILWLINFDVLSSMLCMLREHIRFVFETSFFRFSKLLSKYRCLNSFSLSWTSTFPFNVNWCLCLLCLRKWFRWSLCLLLISYYYSSWYSFWITLFMDYPLFQRGVNSLEWNYLSSRLP